MVKMNGAGAPPLTAPPGLAFRSSRRASPEGACPPLLILGAREPPPLGHFVPALRGTKDEGRGLIYLPPLSENGQAFCSLPVTKLPPVFLPVQAGCIPHRPPLPPSAAPAGITHYTLQARPCAKGEAMPPFGNPRFCRGVATVRISAPVSPPLQNPKKRRRPAHPHGPICAASLLTWRKSFMSAPAASLSGLRAGTGEKRIEEIVFPGCNFRQSGL